MSLGGAWVQVLPVDPPAATRAVRHALANQLLPVTIGLDLLSASLAPESTEALALIASAAESLNRQVLLLDAFSLGCETKAVNVQFPRLDVPGFVTARVPEQLPGVLAALPGTWSAQMRDDRVLLRSSEDAAYQQLCDVPVPAYPFAVPALGVAVSALARCVAHAGGSVHAHPDGLLAVLLPV